MIKHPRKGKPAPRYLVMRHGLIGCVEFAQDSHSLKKKGFHISAILSVIKGATTQVFAKTLAGSTEDKQDLCLSLKFKERTIDIECHSPQARTDLFECLNWISETRINVNSRSALEVESV